MHLSKLLRGILPALLLAATVSSAPADAKLKLNSSDHICPIANDKLSDSNMPDPAANNANIAKYTAAMAEVAKSNNVPFVDLFTASQQLFAQAAKQGQSLTFNTIHLTEAGNKLLAPVIFQN